MSVESRVGVPHAFASAAALRSSTMRPLLAVLVALLGVLVDSAWALDLLQGQRGVPRTQAGAMLGSAQDCGLAAPRVPLVLGDAIEHALCNNPKTHEAWAGIKARAAGVAVAKAAYLPTVSATDQWVRDSSATNVVGQPKLSSARTANVNSGSVSLSWVLYDFGGREAALDNASGLLAAAQANHDSVLQTVFAKVAKDFYDAQAASGNVAAAKEIESAASDSAKVAMERVGKGVAPISDQLQAQTSHAQAMLTRSKAEGDLQAAVGALAADMGLSPTAALELPAVDAGVPPDQAFVESVNELIQEADRVHPDVLAAEAQLRAAQATVVQVAAKGRPTIELVGKYTQNNQPSSAGLGNPDYPASGHDRYVGFQVTIPLFEGLGRSYQVRQAEAQRDAQAASFAAARQKVGLDVWTHYNALCTATTSVSQSALLLSLAERTYEATRKRYRGGVGNILELLNSQSLLETARRQRIQAVTDWRSERLQLGAALGRIGMWMLPE